MQFKLRLKCNHVGISAVEERPHTHPRERRGIPQWNQTLSSCQEKWTKVPQSYLMCSKAGRPKMTAAMHNRKGNRTDETQGNFQIPDVQSVLPPDSRCSEICLCCQRLGNTSSHLQHALLWVFFRFKGVEAPNAVVFILPNKSEHTQAGLDSHLKTLYSLTLVLLLVSVSHS